MIPRGFVCTLSKKHQNVPLPQLPKSVTSPDLFILCSWAHPFLYKGIFKCQVRGDTSSATWFKGPSTERERTWTWHLFPEGGLLGGRKNSLLTAHYFVWRKTWPEWAQLGVQGSVVQLPYGTLLTVVGSDFHCRARMTWGGADRGDIPGLWGLRGS